MKRFHSAFDDKTGFRFGGRLLLLLLAVIGFAACDDFVMYDPFKDPGPLAMEPTAALLKAKQTKEFSATGGAGDYVFALFDGSGSIGSGSGLYQAPDGATEAIIEVTDEAGASEQAIVIVTVPEALSLNRTNVALEPGDEFQFEASGGVLPYEYRVKTGSENIGTIGAADGLFVATAHLDGVTSVGGFVQVTDDVGTIVEATVEVTENPVAVWLEPAGTVKVPENEDKVFRVYGGVSPYSFTFSPNNGELISDGALGRAVYTPDPAAVGSDVEITATEDGGVSVSATVQVVPATPTNLVADGSFGGPKQIRLTWNDNSDGEAGYRVERKTGSAGTFEVLDGGLSAGTTSYEDGGLSPNTGYTYRVIATATDGTYDSLPSSEAFNVSNP